MAFIEKPIWSEDGNTLTNVLVSDILVTYNRTDLWYDGTPLDDSKLDSDLVYVKYEGKYLVRNFEYGQVLQKDTMQEMRDLSSYELLLLKMGVYNHVQLNGYYEKGDTPAPINYTLSDTEEVDDGGSVIEVGNVKLEHEFNSVIDVAYFGAKEGEDSTDEINTSILRAEIGTEVCISKNYLVSSGEARFDEGIKLKSGIVLNLKGELRLVDNELTDSCVVSGYNIHDFEIKGGGSIVGSKHRRRVNGANGVYYKVFRKGDEYYSGDFLTYGQFGFEVLVGGSSDTFIPLTGLNIGSEVTSGSLELIVVETNMGEWGMGLSLWECSDFLIKDITVKECWGDGVYLGGEQSSTTVNLGCTNFIIDNVACFDNRRQGVSIVSARFGTLKFVDLSETYGTNPQSGIDIEPNNFQRVSDIQLIGCRATGNAQDGFKVFADRDNAKASNIHFLQCHSYGNLYGYQFSRDKTSNVTAMGCTAYDNVEDGVFIRDGAHNINIEMLKSWGNNRGIALNGVSRVGINNSEITKSKTSGVAVSGGDVNDSYISNSIISKNGGNGILMSRGKGFDIRSCNTEDNTLSGIRVDGGNNEGLDISSNFVERNGQYGIFLNNSNNSAIRNNSFSGNGHSQPDSFSDISIRDLTSNSSIIGNHFFLKYGLAYVRYNIQVTQQADSIFSLNNKADEDSYLTSHISDSSNNSEIYNLKADQDHYGMVRKSESQLASTATDLSQLVSDFNSLISKLKSADIMSS